MLLPIYWLKQFVEVKESIEAVARRFVSLGFESEVLENATLDLEITPNRGDCLSILGLAREYAASTRQNLMLPETTVLKFGPKLSDFEVALVPEVYHRLAAMIVNEVTVEPSPDWLRQAVESVGMNSINTIVDLTNYIMFELGIPMHAFDLDQLPAKRLSIRLSIAGEHFLSLKDEAITLPKCSIVVESGGQIVDLLGIRGGKSAMIASSTKNIFVWAVCVPRPFIRQTTKLTGLRTEGSYRHERETDWALVTTALERFAYLLGKIRGGTVVSEALVNESKPQPVKAIAFQTNLVNEQLGTSFSDNTIRQSLARLGFGPGDKVTVPSWRYFDINFAEDLVEEVARIEGYAKLPHHVIAKVSRPNDSWYVRIESLKDRLVTAGLTEVYAESFSGHIDENVGLARLANPVNGDFAYCRPAIMSNLLKILAPNSWDDHARLFEIGNVFPEKNLEEMHLAIVVFGRKQSLLAKFVPIECIQFITPDLPLAKLHKLRRPISVAEIPLRKLVLDDLNFNIPQAKPIYRPVSIYPPSVRDISMIINSDVEIEAVSRSITGVSPNRIIGVELFDQFESEQFGHHKQSLAFHVVYQALEKTLEAAEVDKLHGDVAAAMNNQFKAEIR